MVGDFFKTKIRSYISRWLFNSSDYPWKKCHLIPIHSVITSDIFGALLLKLTSKKIHKVNRILVSLKVRSCFSLSPPLKTNKQNQNKTKQKKPHKNTKKNPRVITATLISLMHKIWLSPKLKFTFKRQKLVITDDI